MLQPSKAVSIQVVNLAKQINSRSFKLISHRSNSFCLQTKNNNCMKMLMMIVLDSHHLNRKHKNNKLIVKLLKVIKICLSNNTTSWTVMIIFRVLIQMNKINKKTDIKIKFIRIMTMMQIKILTTALKIIRISQTITIHTKILVSTINNSTTMSIKIIMMRSR